MKILVTGGTGFIGQPLVSALLDKGHDVSVLTRDPSKGTVKNVKYEAWNPEKIAVGELTPLIEDRDAIIHLSGEPIADGRWTSKRKQEIMFSRVNSTRALVDALFSVEERHRVFISSSAIGYYGPRGDDIITEDVEPGDDFLSRVCIEWEREANRAKSVNTRVALIRLGIVLGRDGGALERLARPLESGIGGKLGKGKQWMPWVHREDVVRLILFLLENENAEGPFNVTSPNPVTNEAFTNVLGRVINVNPKLSIPEFLLKFLVGKELADLVLLSGQRALPERAMNMGFEFKFPDLEKALRDIFGK